MTQHCSHVDGRGRNCRRPVSGDTGLCHFHKPHVPFPGAENRPWTEEWATVNHHETIEAPKKIGRQQWDKVQQEEGWWDDALPDATPEELSKEARTKAMVAGRALKAKEIYAIAASGEEVTDEMFGADLPGAVKYSVRGLLLVFIGIPLALWLWAIGEGFGGEFFISFVLSLDYIAAILGAGVLIGVMDFYSRTTQLRKGKRDFLESQEEA
ncbi:MAG: hypothetical protein CMB46_01930 [Euryarchaeota archaeon]|nr:hypothetical protein [Euryarchaeota archaeon]